MNADWRSQIANQAATSPVFEGGNFFTDGNYASLIVEKLLMKQGHSGVSFIGEFRVEESSDVEPGVKACPPGSTASVVYNCTKHPGPSMSNIKALALAIAGLTPAEIDAEQDAENRLAAQEGRQAKNILAEWILRATNEAPTKGTVQPMRGKRVSATTYRKATKTQAAQGASREQWNCYVKFAPIPGQTKEDILAAREKLDKAPTPPPAAPPAPPTPTAPAPTGGGLLGSLDL